MRNISSAILLSIFRQLDVFDGAGSGDGIDGRLSTTSEKMLVIMINIESIISRYLNWEGNEGKYLFNLIL